MEEKLGAYKCDVVAVIKMGAYIHGCLFCVGTDLQYGSMDTVEKHG